MYNTFQDHTSCIILDINVNKVSQYSLHSKLQARFAFAAYLLRVQQRLMLESSEKDLEDVDGANEQMVNILAVM